jgi:hypothetical protein
VQHGAVLLSATASTDSVTTVASPTEKSSKKSRKSSITTSNTASNTSELTFASDVAAVYPTISDSTSQQSTAALVTPAFNNLLLLCKFLISNACSDILLDDTCIERCMIAVLMLDSSDSINDNVVSCSTMTNGHSDSNSSSTMTVVSHEAVVLDSALIETAAAIVPQQDTRVSLAHYILSHAHILGYYRQYIASLLYGYTDSVTLDIKWQYVHALLVHTMHVAAAQTALSRDTVLLLNTLFSCFTASTQTALSVEQRELMFDTVITALSSSSSAVVNEAMYVICTTGYTRDNSITPQQRYAHTPYTPFTLYHYIYI